MKKHDVSGVYLIRCTANAGLYVGSSYAIYSRWYDHRRLLRRDKHTCTYLQNCWNAYGEGSFVFAILEHCEHSKLLEREQHYIDTLKPKLNVMTEVRRWTPSPEMKAKIVASIRARAALRIHCPHGHEYTAENTFFNKKGDKLCRECSRERVRKYYAAETSEQTAARLARGREYNERIRERRLVRQKVYAARTKEAKRLYDIEYRARKKASG